MVMALVESIVTGSAIVALCTFAYNQVNAVFIRSEKYKKASEITHLAMKMLEELNGSTEQKSTEQKITVMTVDNLKEAVENTK